MAVRPRLLLLLACGLFAATPALAAEPCPPRAPRIRVAVVDRPPQLELDLGIDALHALSGERRTARRAHLGLTTSRLEWHSDLNAHIGQEDGGRGRFCAVPGEVVLTLVEAEHRISIAAELPSGGCLWHEVYAHERRHAAVNRQTLGVAVRTAREAATRWARFAAAQGPSADIAMARLQAGLRRAIEPSLAALRAARTRAHAQIDTPEEYRRISSICPADHARLAARQRAIASD